MAVAKRLKAAEKNIEEGKLYSLTDAVSVIKKNATAKFDETLEVAINLGVDPKYSDQMVRGVISLPNGTGKTVRVAVIAKGDKAAEAKKAGADIVGEDELLEEINSGKINFDRCIATPDMMAKVGKVARVLGPRGLMPNPKLGTVTADVAKAVKDAKGGQVQFKVEKTGILQAGVGKASFTEKALVQNILALFVAIQQARPTGVKGTYLQKVALSSTMGRSVKLDVTNLLADIAANK